MSGNLFSLLASGFPADRNRPAFRQPGAADVSYGDLETLAARTAAALRAARVQPGDRVALQVEKSIEAVVIYSVTSVSQRISPQASRCRFMQRRSSLGTQ